MRTPLRGHHAAPPTSARSSTLYDAFVGDTLRAGRSHGQPSERASTTSRGRTFPPSVPANPVFPAILPAVQYGGDSGYPITWRQLQPRVGVIYALPDRRTLLRAAYSPVRQPAGQHHGRRAQRVSGRRRARLSLERRQRKRPRRARRGRPFRTELYHFGVDPRNPGSAAPVNQIAKGLKPPTTDEFIVGAEGQLSSGLVGLARVHPPHGSRPPLLAADRDDERELPIPGHRRPEPWSARTASF